MAELLTIPASAVALVQAIELACDSIARIYGSKDAPREARRVNQELQQVLTLVQQIKQYARRNENTSSNEAETVLRTQISSLKSDLDGYINFVRPHLSQGTSWARLKLRTKWVMGLDKRLVEISERISAHENRLQLAFSLYSSYESRASSQRVRKQLDVLSRAQETQVGSPSIIANSQSVLANSGSPNRTGVTTFTTGSIPLCGRLLSEAAPIVYGLVMNSGLAPTSRGQWVLSQLYGILHEIFSGGIREIEIPDSTSPSRALADENETDTTTFQGASKHLDLAYLPKTTALISSISAEAQSHQHQVYLTLIDYRQAPSARGHEMVSFARCRLQVESKLDSETTGFIVQVSEFAGPQARVCRTLSAFGVHPLDTPIFVHIKSGNIPAVQRMLSLRLVSPNDRDEDGNSLLWHSIWGHSKTSYEMCQLLLQETADASDCNRAGDHAMAVLVMNLDMLPKSQLTNVMKIMNLLLRHCETTDISGTLQYKRRNGIDRAPASLLHCAIPRRQEASIPTLPSLFYWLVKRSTDLELTDKNGNTALLYSLFYYPAVFTANVLLDAGADARVTNKYGENGLHLLCRRLSACDKEHISNGAKLGITKLLARLIRAGVDPVAGNHVGFTAIDAAMSPRAWPLLCAALRENGRSMRDEVHLLDLAAGITLPETGIETKLSQVIRQRQTPTITKDYFALGAEQPKATTNTPSSGDQATMYYCYLCSRTSETFFRPAPFDEFRSEIVDELGQGIHTVLYSHPCDGECLRVSEEDSCFTLDYHPGEMSRERLVERSWRRHVAAVLEEKGLLDLY